MRCPGIASAYATPHAIKPDFGQVAENAIETPSDECGHVFHDDEARQKLANDSRELAPQSGASASEPATLPRDRNILTGEAAADEIDGAERSRRSFPNIHHTPIHFRPVTRQNEPREARELHLPDHPRRNPRLDKGRL